MRNRIVAGACAVLGAALLAAPIARAGVERKSLYRGSHQPIGIAVDGSGRVHLSWQSSDHHLHYARIDGAKRRDELVDPNDSGYWSSIALDSAGHPHVAYHAELGGPDGSVLMYAHFDGAAWSFENLGPGGYATAIAVDADDRPHVAHARGDGSFEYLHLDTGGWERESPVAFGAWGATPMSLALDSAGHAHLGLEDPNTHRPLYATNASGDWVATELADSSGRGASIALDALERPRAAIPLSDFGTIRYSRFDGASWVSEDLYDPNDFPTGASNAPSGAALVLDAQDRPQILFTTNLLDASGTAQVVSYAHRDGAEWRGGNLERRGGGGFVGLVMGSDGAARGVYSLVRPTALDTQQGRSVRVTLPDLTGEWTSLAATEKNGTTRVDGVLQVRNDGADKSKSVRIAIYLSEDATLDATDTWVFLPKSIGAVAPGKTKSVRFSFTRLGLWSGKHLIAVIDPARLADDLDRPNNTIPGPLP